MMEINRVIKLKFLILSGLVLALNFSCERDLTDEAVEASFPNTADIFTDAPVGLTDEFFISFDPALGANTEAFGTDDNVAFEGTSSIRIDVPAANDPNGGFVGGIFLDRGEGRDLSGFNVLTFWAKGSVTATLALSGFGTDFIENRFAVVGEPIQLSTDWRQYIIPIPDPSKLTQERGMFIFSAGGLDIIDNIPNGNEIGFTFWIDELRFENLGTIGQPRPAILGGMDFTEQSFIGSNFTLEGLSHTVNLPTGGDTTVSLAPAYFDFTSSNPDVATVNDLGEVNVVGVGTAVITAVLNGVEAEGSIEIISAGEFPTAPVPTLPQSEVVSLFSDAYTNIPVDFYNGNFENQGTTGGVVNIGNDEILLYSNFDQQFGFVTTQFINPTVDLSAETMIHFDLFIQEAIDPGDLLTLELVNAGPDQTITPFEDNGGALTIGTAELSSGEWISFDLSLSDFVNPTGGGLFTGGIGDRANMGSLTFASGLTLSSIIVDNIYFY